MEPDEKGAPGDGGWNPRSSREPVWVALLSAEQTDVSSQSSSFIWVCNFKKKF